MTDWLRNRKQVWVRFDRKDAYGNNVCEPSGYDLGQDSTGQDVFETSINPRAIRSDGQTSGRIYTGVAFMDERDLATRVPQGAGFGGLRPFALT